VWEADVGLGTGAEAAGVELEVVAVFPPQAERLKSSAAQTLQHFHVFNAISSLFTPD